MAERPKRQSIPSTELKHDPDQWTTLETRRLMKALLRHRPHEFEQISRYIDTKSAREVKAYMQIIQEKVKKEVNNRPKQPIEEWTRLASNLISCEAKDYSEVLTQVMSIAGNLENVEEEEEDSEDQNNGKRKKKQYSEEPNYPSIYRYLAAVLAGQHLPVLGKTECAIVLDLMHGLNDTIRTSDTSRQQQIMLWKHHLLSSKINKYDPSSYIERCRKSIDNDFSDFGQPKPVKKPSKSNIPGPSTSVQPKKPIIQSNAPGPSSSVQHKKPIIQSQSSSKVNPGSLRKRSSTSDSQDPAPVKQTRSSESETSSGKHTRSAAEKNISPTGSSEKTPGKSPAVKRTRSSESESSTSKERKSSIEKDMSPNGADEKTPTKTTGKRGRPKKDSAVNKIGESGDSKEKNASSESSTSNGTQPGTSGDSAMQPDKHSANQNNINQESEETNEDIPKKPALFTLNPFCIPIDMLKFQPIVSSQVVFVQKPPQKLQKVEGPGYKKEKYLPAWREEVIIIPPEERGPQSPTQDSNINQATQNMDTDNGTTQNMDTNV